MTISRHQILGLILILLVCLLVGLGLTHLRKHSTSPAESYNVMTICQADRATLKNVDQIKTIAHLAQLPNFQALYLSDQQRCSAQFAYLNHDTKNLPARVLKVALDAYNHARKKGLDKKRLLTIVDYEKASNLKRMWVFDLRHNKLLLNTYVSHGAKSGVLYAKYFSNKIDSHMSSIGVLMTDKPYYGIKGESLRLQGLEPGFNNNISQRDIVIHPAKYVTQDFINKYHRAGRSYGCLAVSNKVADQLIGLIEDGTIIVDYFPSEQWLKESTYLH